MQISLISYSWFLKRNKRGPELIPFKCRAFGEALTIIHVSFHAIICEIWTMRLWNKVYGKCVARSNPSIEVCKMWIHILSYVFTYFIHFSWDRKYPDLQSSQCLPSLISEHSHSQSSLGPNNLPSYKKKQLC
jgi:hypothetical protein